MVAIVPAVNIAAIDSEVPTPTPRSLPSLAQSVTGTPGTDGQLAIGTYRGFPIPEPHRVWRFDIKLPFIGQGVKEPIVQSMEPSFDNTGAEPHSIGGRHHFGASFFDCHEFRILFYDDQEQTPIDYIFAWKKLMRNYNSDGIDDGTYKYPEGENGYFQDISVYLLDMQARRRYQIIYHKCFPTVMAPLRLDFEPSGRTVIAQAFAVNRVITKKISVQQSTANPTIAPAGASLNLANVQRIQI